MEFKKSLIFTCCSLMLVLLVSCFGPEEEEGNNPDGDKTEDSTTFKLKAEAIINPDSTIEIYAENIPFRNSWVISRNGVVLDTLWNKVWSDTVPFTAESRYSIEVLNEQGLSILTEEITPIEHDNNTEVGVLYPYPKTKCILGTEQVVMWNPESFPKENVTVRAHFQLRHNKGHYDHWKDMVTLSNKGTATISIPTEYYTAEYVKPEESYFHVKFYVFPEGSHEQDVYAYASNSIRIHTPNYSEIITYPTLGDTINVGKTSYITWDKNILPNDKVNISLRDERIGMVLDLKSIDNSGEHVWTVPNIKEGYYHLVIDYKDDSNKDKLLVSYPFYVTL